MVRFGEQTVHELIDKNSRGDYFQVSSVDDGKMWSLDVRQMYTDYAGDIKPTQKGVRVNEETVVDLLAACIKALPEDLYEELMNRVDEMEVAQ